MLNLLFQDQKSKISKKWLVKIKILAHNFCHKYRFSKKSKFSKICIVINIKMLPNKNNFSKNGNFNDRKANIEMFAKIVSFVFTYYDLKSTIDILVKHFLTKALVVFVSLSCMSLLGQCSEKNRIVNIVIPKANFIKKKFYEIL